MSKAKSYSFPTFYACYLLKSVKSIRTYRNYIGSTSHPVRRLRQHNGILAGGARNTTAKRPWVMHLLVHGFPSRPAATSFEFAWQNPHKSRFLRDDTGNSLFEKRGARLSENIQVLQRLIRTHPFSTWPLHVKLFTEEVVHLWNTLASTSPLFSAYQHHIRCHNSDDNNRAFGDETTQEKGHPDQQFNGLLFPPGFTCSVELEGVDGTSGIRGSGREGPVCITDEYFTSPYLAKNTAVVAAGHLLNCSVCAAPIHDFPSDHLGTMLCTHTGCTAVSHLACLAKSWLENERSLLTSSSLSSTLFSRTTSSSPSLHFPPACSTSPHPLGQNLPASATPSPPSVPLSSFSGSHSSPCSSSASLSITLSTPPFTVLSPSPTNLIASTTKSKSKNSTNSGPHSSPPPHVLENPFSLGKGMLPRGGTCKSCGNYTLWGDMVKGCFRRHSGRVVDYRDEDDAEGVEELEEEAEGIKEQEELENLSGTDLGLVSEGSNSNSDSGLRATRLRSRSDPKKLARELDLLSLDNSTSRASRRGRPATKADKKNKKTKGMAESKGKVKRKTSLSNTATSRSASPTTNSPLPARGRGRPKKHGLTAEPKPELESSNIGAVPPRKRGRPRKEGASSSTILVPVIEPLTFTSVRPGRGRPRKQSLASSISPACLPSSAPSHGAQPELGSAVPPTTTRKRGRPRKQSEVPPVTSSDPLSSISTTIPRRRARKAPSSPLVYEVDVLPSALELPQSDFSVPPEFNKTSEPVPGSQSEQKSSTTLRKRGRPPKPQRQNVTTIIPSNITTEPEPPSLAPATPKRSRGRPRKNDGASSTLMDGCTLSIRMNDKSNGCEKPEEDTFEVTALTPSGAGARASRDVKPLSTVGSPVKRGRGRPRRSSA